MRWARAAFIAGAEARQLIVLNGTPIIVHTIRKFDACSVIDYVIGIQGDVL